jgi:hypothetical protein
VNYTVPRIMRLKGPLNVAAMERTLTTIVERHEVLRTSITVVDGAAVQTVRTANPITIRVIDLTSEPLAAREERGIETVKELIRRPFDLSRDDLLRPTVIRLSDDECIFLLESHHIASDSWSKGVLFNELETLYAAHCQGQPYELPELPIQYSDYAIWQRETLSDLVLKDELAYWRQHLTGAPAARIPVRQAPSVGPEFSGKGQRFHFSKALLDAAQQFSARSGDAVHDAAGGVRRVRRPLHGADGPGHRHADRRPESSRAGTSDRVLHEHAGAPHRSRGRSHVP